MKTPTLKGILVGFVFASAAVAIPVTATLSVEQPPSTLDWPVRAVGENNLNGKITDKSSTDITVGVQPVSVTGATQILKSGEQIKLEDLKVGDDVSVATIKAEDGKLLAVTVEVVRI